MKLFGVFSQQHRSRQSWRRRSRCVRRPRCSRENRFAERERAHAVYCPPEEKARRKQVLKTFERRCWRSQDLLPHPPEGKGSNRFGRPEHHSATVSCARSPPASNDFWLKPLGFGRNAEPTIDDIDTLVGPRAAFRAPAPSAPRGADRRPAGGSSGPTLRRGEARAAQRLAYASSKAEDGGREPRSSRLAAAAVSAPADAPAPAPMTFRARRSS